MLINEIASNINAQIHCIEGNENIDITKAFTSDLMSDVLTIEDSDVVLITGLANIQTIRTADMADIRCIILGRNKHPSSEMLELAEDIGITVLVCPLTLFHISGILYNKGINPILIK
ncbi:MAG: hypothetical protein PHU62_06250 [Bacteroidales bacterium]|jgi:serine kinase of HPr protein (carbohydrate metabolism regulator)|nr:hypothetical protein [Bacteroidales bacterium]MDD2204881.1 hypothetical protein [Bacteroidales bacterium]MDD3913537.1 hypothetical protein [Bacteroidales bacterium]MDD4634152.1 hypothetical protein [Bacteroidales bacterium]